MPYLDTSESAEGDVGYLRDSATDEVLGIIAFIAADKFRSYYVERGTYIKGVEDHDNLGMAYRWIMDKHDGR